MREQLSILRAVLLRAAIVTGRVAKRVLLRLLEGLERPLLNAAARERIHATATFTLIFAFAVTSVDFLITGGFDFGPPAARAHSVAQTSVIAARASPPLSVPLAAPQPAPVERPAALAPALAEVTQAHVVPVSQEFSAPAPEAAPITRRPLAGGAALITIADPAEAPKHEPTPRGESAAAPKKDSL